MTVIHKKYTLNLYSNVCQLCLSETGERSERKEEKQMEEWLRDL